MRWFANTSCSWESVRTGRLKLLDQEAITRPQGSSRPENTTDESPTPSPSSLLVRIDYFNSTSAFRAAYAQGTPPPWVPNPASEDAVLEWNCRAVKYGLSSTFAGALRQIRAMAVVQLQNASADLGRRISRFVYTHALRSCTTRKCR